MSVALKRTSRVVRRPLSRTIAHDERATVGGPNYTGAGGPSALEQIAKVLKGKARKTNRTNPFLGGFVPWRDPRRFRMPTSEEEWSKVDNYVTSYRNAAWYFHPTWSPKNSLRLGSIWPGCELGTIIVLGYILYDQLTYDGRFIHWTQGLMVGPEYRAYAKLDETGFFDRYYAAHGDH